MRRELGILPGTEVDIRKEGDRYVLLVSPIKRLRSKWCGRFRRGTSTMDYLDEVRGDVS